MTDTASESPGDAPPPRVLLVPINDEGRFAVLAESPTDARNTVEALSAISPRGSDTHTPHTTDGGAGLALQALGELGKALSLQGSMQLAPETLHLLAIPGNQLMQSGGQALGTVVNAKGQIVANATLVGVSGATQVAALASTLGMSVALAAIQLQLARIEKALSALTDLVRDLADEEREHRWADIEVRIDRIVLEASLAVEAGQVPAGVLDELRGDAHALEAFSRGAARTLARRTRELESASKADAQRHRLQRDAYALARDLVNAVAAADCLYAYEVIRAATAAQNHPGPLTDFHNDRVLRAAARRADDLRAEAAKASRNLQRRLHQIETRPGSGLKPGTRTQAKELATQVARTIATIAPEPPAIQVPTISGLAPEEASQLRQELRWAPDITRVNALYGALASRLPTGPSGLRQAADAVSSRDAFIAITPSRILIGLTKEFTSTGELTADIHADDCKVSGTGRDDGAFVIHTPTGDIQLRPRADQLALSPSWLGHQVREAVAAAQAPSTPLQITQTAWTPTAGSGQSSPSN